MTRVSQFFSKMFKGKADPKPLPPKDEHFSVPAPQTPEKPSRKPVIERSEGVTSFGTFQRIKPICGHRVTPLNRQQKRDLSKLFGEKIL